jgi:3-oxoacyl-[acyl-carrier protein] reductase
MPLQGKVAIVTGSSRGIGRAVALTFAARGTKVLINSSRWPRMLNMAIDQGP